MNSRFSNSTLKFDMHTKRPSGGLFFFGIQKPPKDFTGFRCHFGFNSVIGTRRFVWWMSLNESVSAIWNTVRTVFWFESLRLASEPNAILSPPKSGDWIESRGFQFLETGVQAPVEYS